MCFISDLAGKPERRGLLPADLLFPSEELPLALPSYAAADRWESWTLPPGGGEGQCEGVMGVNLYFSFIRTISAQTLHPENSVAVCIVSFHIHDFNQPEADYKSRNKMKYEFACVRLLPGSWAACRERGQVWSGLSTAKPQTGTGTATQSTYRNTGCLGFHQHKVTSLSQTLK